LRGHPAEKALSFQLLRSLKQAVYEVVNLGHFGLASRSYLHFTSPIRRYPDVVVHRLLKHRLAAEGKPAGGFAPPARDDAPSSTAALQKTCADASFCERKTMEVEREVVSLYRSFFMRDRIGDVLEGTVSGVASFGLFVTADEPFVEGLVKVEYLAPDDHYLFDETALRLAGRRTGRSFALGDRVRVEVLSVSVARRQIDFRVHDPGPHPPRSQKRPRRGAQGKPPSGHASAPEREHERRKARGQRWRSGRGGRPRK
jgi:ribonuclease R